MKSGTRPSEVTGESLYKTGNLFRISHVQPADDGYLDLCCRSCRGSRRSPCLKRTGRFYAAYEPVADIKDLEEDLQDSDPYGHKKHDPRDQQPLPRLRTVHPADRPDGVCRPDHGVRHALPAGPPCREAGAP
ncbi:MAG: hypothetical protein MZV63_46210 [Marinilabiliales bacterium]|nr:hypothetical protein [Marinilabiliales bacterium]